MAIVHISKVAEFKPFVAFEKNEAGLSGICFVTGPMFDPISRSGDKEQITIGTTIPVFPAKRSGIQRGVVRVDSLDPHWSKKGMFVGYGFVTGTMPVYNWPTDRSIEQWLEKKVDENSRCWADGTVNWLHTEANGDFILVVADDERAFLVAGAEGECKELEGTEYSAFESSYFLGGWSTYRVKYMTTEELAMFELLGPDAESRLAIEPMEFEVEMEGFRACPPSRTFVSKLLDEVEEWAEGWLKQYTFAGHCYYRCCSKYSGGARLLLVRNFAPDEIDAIVREASEVNRKATAAYRDLIKKGKMRIRRGFDKMYLLQEGQR